MSSKATRGLRLEVRGWHRMAREMKTLLGRSDAVVRRVLPIRHDRTGYASTRCQDSIRGALKTSGQIR